MFLLQRNNWIAILRAVTPQIFTELLRRIPKRGVSEGLAENPASRKACNTKWEKVCGMMETHLQWVLKCTVHSAFLPVFRYSRCGLCVQGPISSCVVESAALHLCSASCSNALTGRFFLLKENESGYNNEREKFLLNPSWYSELLQLGLFACLLFV